MKGREFVPLARSVVEQAQRVSIERADVFLCHNNGVTALLINPEGPLAQLAKFNENGQQLCWVFSAIDMVRDPNSAREIETFVPDMACMEAFHGSPDQLAAIKQWLVSKGMIHATLTGKNAFHVPCSGHRGRQVMINDRPCYHWEEAELALRRTDQCWLVLQSGLRLIPRSRRR